MGFKTATVQGLYEATAHMRGKHHLGGFVSCESDERVCATLAEYCSGETLYEEDIL